MGSSKTIFPTWLESGSYNARCVNQGHINIVQAALYVSLLPYQEKAIWLFGLSLTEVCPLEAFGSEAKAFSASSMQIRMVGTEEYKVFLIIFAQNSPDL
jgi:hypothetical protein